VAYASGDRRALGRRWLNSFGLHAATMGVDKGLDVGLTKAVKHAGKVPAVGAVLKPIAKGAKIAVDVGRYAGTGLAVVNTGCALYSGDLRSVYNNVSFARTDILAAKLGFLSTYLGLPMIGSSESPTIGYASYGHGNMYRGAFVFRGGLVGAVLPPKKWGFTFGHNIFINGSNWSRTNSYDRSVTMGHGFEHVFQYEKYGAGFFDPYLNRKVPYPFGQSEELQARWSRSKGRRLEWDAYSWEEDWAPRVEWWF